MESHLRSINLLSDFLDENIKIFIQTEGKEPSILYSKKGVFLGDHTPFSNHVHTISKLAEEKPSEKFDIVLVNPSFSKMINSTQDDPIFTQITSYLSSLRDNGIAYVLMPSFEKSISNGRFIQKLREKRFYINSVFQLPNDFLRPDTSIRPLLVSITKSETPLIFFAEFEGWDGNAFGQFEILAENLIVNSRHDWDDDIIDEAEDLHFEGNVTEVNEHEDLWHGVYSTFDNFLGFEYWKYADELRKINSDYKKFKSIKLGELCTKINLIKSGENFDTEIENCIYLPLIGTQSVVGSISNLKIKPHNYAQLVLIKEGVDCR